MHANYLDTLDWGILIAYFLILIGIGIWASLKRKKGSSLFLAERSLKWHHIGFSMWGTNVGPSMLIASASAGFTTGIVSGNYAWYAFVFICLLAFVFAPRYLGARITTLPEFMGRRFGQSTRNILAWYTIVTILISWLALTLFAGGILIRQVFDIPMWQSALILLVISAFFTMAGGLKAVAYTNVFQMLLLIFVSATLTIAGLYKVGGVSALAEAVPADYWNLFRPNDDPAFPWLPIILGYPIMGVWFWCTDQSMVQPVLAAKNLKEGQMGANFTGWLKILDVPLYILPGIICLALYPGLKNPDEAYMTMVTNLFPVGMVGLVLAVLTAALISTVGSALNALSTVFTMDIYVKKFRPLASQKEIIRTGHVVTMAGALISVIITIAILPAVFLPLQARDGLDDRRMVEALYVAAGFGQVIATRASISGAEGGCQAEVGSASGMAAAALVYVMGGTPGQMAHACAMALSNTLGLVCDPVAGLVEVPCVNRNVMGAVNALSCAEMALSGVESAIPCDEVIDAMRAVGDALPASLRETGSGGLAATPTGRRLAERL